MLWVRLPTSSGTRPRLQWAEIAIRLARAVAHHVVFIDERRWRSLSAIAREITGTSRNGPAFFGLRGGATHGAA